MTVIQIDLSGRTILITGAMNAIAKHMVRRLTAAGATVALLDLKPASEAHGALRKWQVPNRSYAESIADAPLAAEISGQTLGADYGSGIRNRL